MGARMSRVRSAAARVAPPGRVRIIAGSLRGSRLAVPDLPGLRPTPDRVRETLFNWLQPLLPGARCLDLYAGSGALGIEALSRGAQSVCMVERAPTLVAALRANLDRLEQHAGTVVQAAALDYLARAPQPFDVVFLDPPYAADAWSAAATALRPWMAPRARVYVEHPAAAPAPPLPAHWQALRSARAGAVGYALYRVDTLG
jgi:16S rRNA (guanine966-N2)-methyltransferase